MPVTAAKPRRVKGIRREKAAIMEFMVFYCFISVLSGAQGLEDCPMRRMRVLIPSLLLIVGIGLLLLNFRAVTFYLGGFFKRIDTATGKFL